MSGWMFTCSSNDLLIDAYIVRTFKMKTPLDLGPTCQGKSSSVYVHPTSTRCLSTLSFCIDRVALHPIPQLRSIIRHRTAVAVFIDLSLSLEQFWCEPPVTAFIPKIAEDMVG